MTIDSFHRRALLAGAGAFSAASLVPARRVFAQAAERLRVVQPWALRSLKLSTSGSGLSRPGITEGLVAVEPDGQIAPALAESWSASADGLTWRFKLRAAAIFHDGSPVTAATVKASFDRLLPSALYLKSAGIVSVSAEPGEVVFKLGTPFGSFLDYLVDYSTHVLAPASFDSAGEVSQIVATGPYRIVEADLPRGLVLARFDKYWGPKPAFASASVDAVVNGETRANIAAAGDADIVINVPTPSLSRLQSAGTARIERVIIPRVHILMVNCAKPQFSDVRTRRALNLAVDRAGIAASIMRNPALAATQYLPPPLAKWHFADLTPHKRDLAAANRLLDEAGWATGPDGIRVKDGVKFAGNLKTFANRPELPVIATALQSQLKAVGFDLSVSVGEWQAITDAKRDGSLDLALNSRNVAIVPDPISSLALDFTTDNATSLDTGATSWSHDGLRQDVAAYLATNDETLRAPLRRRIVGVLHDELPVMPIVWYDQLVTVANRIGEVPIDPFEQRYLLERIRTKA